MKKFFLASSTPFGDRGRDLLGLAVPDSYATVAVADDHQGGEAEPTSTLHDLGHTVDRHDPLQVLVAVVLAPILRSRRSPPPRRCAASFSLA